MSRKKKCEMCGEWFLPKGLTTHKWSELNEGQRVCRVPATVQMCKACLGESRYYSEIEYYKRARGK